jgi:hypothetical protein
MSSERKGPQVRKSDPPIEELKQERDEFLKSFFRNGAKFTEELFNEREHARRKVAELEEENARLRAQIASNSAIRDLIAKIGDLEKEKESLIKRTRKIEELSNITQESYGEVEAELANLANLYVASYQLHSSLSPRGVMRNIKELLAQLVGAEVYAVYLKDEEGDLLVPITSEGLSEGELLPIQVGEGWVGESFQKGEDFVTTDNTRDGSLDRPSALVVLRMAERMMGIISVVRTLEQKTCFLQVDRELMKLLGAQAMSALVAASLYTNQGGKVPSHISFLELGL